MRLILIRHGQSANNLLADSHGHDYAAYMAGRSSEPPLTAIGHQQAERLAEQLAAAAQWEASVRLAWVPQEHPIHTLYVSPMLRALQTAEPIARCLGLAPQVWVDLHEHGGIFTGNPEVGDVVGYPGLTRNEMADRFPAYVLSHDVGDDGWWRSGYEEMDFCYLRAQRVAQRLYALAEQAPEETIALVTHGTFLDNLMHALFVPGEVYDDRVHFSHLNTAVSRVDFSDGHLALRYLNRVDHLPLALVTR